MFSPKAVSAALRPSSFISQAIADALAAVFGQGSGKVRLGAVLNRALPSENPTGAVCVIRMREIAL